MLPKSSFFTKLIFIADLKPGPLSGTTTSMLCVLRFVFVIATHAIGRLGD